MTEPVQTERPSDDGRLLVVRHGTTEWSQSGRHTSHTDLPLLPDGEEQARRLTDALSEYSPTRILASPLQRARRTAELAGYGAVEIDSDLTEWDYGAYEGRTRAEIQQQRPGWSIWDGTPEDGELITDVAARAGRVLEELRLDLEAGRCVAVFSHGHFSRVLLATWIGLGPAAGRLFDLDPGSYGVLGTDRGQRVVHHWNQRP